MLLHPDARQQWLQVTGGLLDLLWIIQADGGGDGSGVDPGLAYNACSVLKVWGAGCRGSQVVTGACSCLCRHVQTFGFGARWRTHCLWLVLGLLLLVCLTKLGHCVQVGQHVLQLCCSFVCTCAFLICMICTPPPVYIPH